MIANRKCSYCNGHIKPEAKDCLQHLKNCSLCPQAIKDFAKDKMIELGLKDNDDNSHRERERAKSEKSQQLTQSVQTGWL
jgi:ethanolamine utilization cobalamin adenosyltransferase